MYFVSSGEKRGGKKKKKSVGVYIGRYQNFKSLLCAGGRHQTTLNGEIIYEYLQSCTDAKLSNDSQYFIGKQFDFRKYKLLSAISEKELEQSVPLFFSKIPLEWLSIYLNMKELREMSVLHKIPMPYKAEKAKMLMYFCDHHFNQCDLHISILTERKPKEKKKSKVKEDEGIKLPTELPTNFPPEPPSKTLLESIIKGFCDDSSPKYFIDAGCAVCGRLFSVEDMKLLDEINCNLDVISPGDIGRCERLCETDPVVPLKGPILAEDCDHVCFTCQNYLKKKKLPPESLANSFWIGRIPTPLQNLTFAEKMLISKIRHNKCLVRVSSGRAKMTANVIMFSNPTVKVYHALPPSRHEISEILAFVFQGPIQPTESLLARDY